MNTMHPVPRQPTGATGLSPGGWEPSPSWRLLPVLLTLCAALAAAALAWVAWNVWVALPWTRDGRVRVYVVSLAPEVAGRIVDLRVRDNQFVRKDDVLMVVDPTDYAITVSASEAALKQAMADRNTKLQQAQRRQSLTTLSTSVEETLSYVSGAQMADAAVERAQSQLAQARLNLERTQMRSPVHGWVTNLQARVGDYATVGQRNIAIIDSDSFWLDGYFEETAVARIRDGDPALIHLVGYRQTLQGRVDSVARGIQVDNAQSDQSGLATVNPIFTWVRLAQRIPVRIVSEEVPDDVRLAAGMTATVQVDVGPRR